MLFVKRITAINGTAINTLVDDTTSPFKADDNAAGWPSGYLRGAIDNVKAKPVDELEYTIYFLNDGESNAKKALLCDLLTANQPINQFDEPLFGANVGGSNYPLTDGNDTADRAQKLAAGAVPTACNSATSNLYETLTVDIAGTTGSPNLPSLLGFYWGWLLLIIPLGTSVQNYG